MDVPTVFDIIHYCVVTLGFAGAVLIMFAGL